MPEAAVVIEEVYTITVDAVDCTSNTDVGRVTNLMLVIEVELKTPKDRDLTIIVQ